MQKYQGDVAIISIPENQLPKELNFKKFPPEGVVVAEGEVTGHKHTIVAEKENLIEIAQDGRGYYLKVNNGSAVITHQEHKPITIEQGIYFIGRQWEYDEIANRRVQD